MSPTKKRFVSYLRVSTSRQGQSGLGIEAQRSAVLSFLNGGNWTLVGEFVEVESGKNNERPELKNALAACRIHGATLVVSRLDRLARNAHFLLGLKEAGVEFVCVDMPTANALTVGIMAMVAQEEARLVSARTKAALQMAKERGVKLGSPKPITRRAQKLGTVASVRVRRNLSDRWRVDVLPVVRAAYGQSGSLRGAASILTAQGVPARRGGPWSPTQVMRVLKES